MRRRENQQQIFYTLLPFYYKNYSLVRTEEASAACCAGSLMERPGFTENSGARANGAPGVSPALGPPLASLEPQGDETP